MFNKVGSDGNTLTFFALRERRELMTNCLFTITVFYIMYQNLGRDLNLSLDVSRCLDLGVRLDLSLYLPTKY